MARIIEQIKAVAAAARAEADGYKGAYTFTAEELSNKRILLDQYRALLAASTAERAEAIRKQQEPFVPRAAPEVTSFLVLGNGRTGSTWFVSNCDRLPDVVAQREINWRVPGMAPNRVQVHIDGTTRSLADAVSEANDVTGLPRKRLGHVAISGSKLIYHPYGFLGQDIFNHLGRIAEPELRLISLRRSYLEWFLSWKARGVYHEVHEDVYAGMAGSKLVERELEQLRAQTKPRTRNIVLTFSGVPLADPARIEDPIHYPLLDAIDDMLMAFWHDLRSIALVKEKNGLVLDYSEVATRLPEYARFVGSAAPDEILADIAARPMTKRLEVLPPSLVSPQEILVEASNILDEAIKDVAEGKQEADQLWAWNGPAAAAVDLPRLKQLLERLGVDCSGASFGIGTHPDARRINWSLRKPVYTL